MVQEVMHHEDVNCVEFLSGQFGCFELGVVWVAFSQ